MKAPKPLILVKRRVLSIIDTIRHMPSGIRGSEQRMLALKSQLEELQDQAKSTSRHVLFSTVGRALTSWARMEEPLVIITGQLLRIPPDKAGILLYSIQNPRVWLMAIDDLFELDPVLVHHKRKFDKVSDRIGKLIDKRNQLAHHSIRMAAVHIKASDLDGRTKSKKQAPLSIDEVRDFTDAVLTIAEDLHALASTMRQTLEPSPKESG